jgi:hypothetical protein
MNIEISPFSKAVIGRPLEEVPQEWTSKSDASAEGVCAGLLRARITTSDAAWTVDRISTPWLPLPPNAPKKSAFEQIVFQRSASGRPTFFESNGWTSFARAGAATARLFD